MEEFVAVCCSVLQCVAVCCSVLQENGGDKMEERAKWNKQTKWKRQSKRDIK